MIPCFTVRGKESKGNERERNVVDRARVRSVLFIRGRESVTGLPRIVRIYLCVPRDDQRFVYFGAFYRYLSCLATSAGHFHEILESDRQQPSLVADVRRSRLCEFSKSKQTFSYCFLAFVNMAR